MRRPRDFDSELRALAGKARQLKERRTYQLGALVAATGADALDADMLAGVLLAAVASTDTATREAWRTAGVAFFRDRQRKPRAHAHGGRTGAQADDGDAASA